jgi:uncharacterized protein YjbI with pentapeptide repeats
VVLVRANLWQAKLKDANLLYANIEGAKGLPVDIYEQLKEKP